VEYNSGKEIFMALKVAPIVINDEFTNELARQLAERTGVPVELAIRDSLQERLARLSSEGESKSLRETLKEIAIKCATRPVIDYRSSDEILNYDSNGLPS